MRMKVKNFYHQVHHTIRDKVKLAICFETPQAAKSRTENNVRKIGSGDKKPKKKTTSAKYQVTHMTNKALKNTSKV